MKRAGFPLLLAVLGIGAYAGTFSAPFIFDDDAGIINDMNIRRLWPPWPALSGIRPVVRFSFAVNYALGGFQVWGWHAVNVGVHLAAGLLLFGIVRRTLLTERLRPRYGAKAHGLALAVASIWTLHPLQTGAVTYLVQRAEAMAGFFLFLSLYASLRGRPLLSAVSAWLAVGSKANAAVAPLLILLHDRVYLSGSFLEALRRRPGFYLGIFSSWAALAALLIANPFGDKPTAGFALKDLTPWEYAATQPGVILQYLRLTFWPKPLCLDYHWPVAESFGRIVPPLCAVGALLAAAVWVYRRKPEAGFPMLWFFLTLAPTSSFIPIADLIFEHRMYLPLAGIAAALVFTVDRLVGKRWEMAVVLLSAAALTLGVGTFLRNREFRSDEAVWRSVIDARHPDAARPYNNLGLALVTQGRYDEALGCFDEAIRRDPSYAKTYNNMGLLLSRLGRHDEAVFALKEAVRLEPDYPEAYSNLGLVLERQGNLREAESVYRKAIEVGPLFPKAHSNLGAVLAKQGRLGEAVRCYEQTLRLDPDNSEAYNGLGDVLAREGRLKESVPLFEKAVRLDPKNSIARRNLGNVLEYLKSQDTR